MIAPKDYPILLTPGPLTTSLRTKEAMLRDWGSWDEDFNQITARIREMLIRVVHGEGIHECVPLQGSGTFSVEAAVGTLVPRDGNVLVPINGAYCERIAKICKYLNRRLTIHKYAENALVRPEDIDRLLTADPSITDVALVHCETSTGILNPLHEIALVVEKHGKRLIVDAMSSFGALEIDARRTPFDALVAASGKCLEGVPGMGFVLVKRSTLENCEGNCHSLAMDLYDQWVYMGKTTQWRFTPPTHVVASLEAALNQYWQEGGQESRGARYAKNCRQLIGGLNALGLRSFLDPAIQAPIIVTFYAPEDCNYRFKTFYDEVKKRGYVLYPGKLTTVDTFRVGCMGVMDADEMSNVVGAIAESLKEMGVKMATTEDALARV